MAIDFTDKKQLAKYLKGKTPEQKKVIKYFVGMDGGCLSKGMADSEYDAMVMAAVDALNLKARALDKIGLDESEVNEIAPVNFSSYCYDGNVFTRVGKSDDYIRSSAYQVSWIFFSATQVYLYQYTLNMDDNSKKETTEEYFYKDVVNFNTASETKDVVKQKTNCLGGVKNEHVNREYERFSIIVPGDKFYCSLRKTDEIEAAIKGMKALLREKKNNG